MVASYVEMLRGGLAASAPTAVFFEDDLRFNLHLFHNLRSWDAWTVSKQGGHFAGSLFNARRSAVPVQGFAVTTSADPERFSGAQAIVLGLETLSFVIDHWDEEGGFPDLRVARLASRVTPFVVHSPSLVQHVGLRSGFGHPYIRAYDFYRDWRAQRQESR